VQSCASFPSPGCEGLHVDRGAGLSAPTLRLETIVAGIGVDIIIVVQLLLGEAAKVRFDPAVICSMGFWKLVLCRLGKCLPAPLPLGPQHKASTSQQEQGPQHNLA
jgi:hypothetical protein